MFQSFRYLIVLIVSILLCSCGSTYSTRTTAYSPTENNQMVLNAHTQPEASYENEQFLVNAVHLKTFGSTASFGVLIENYSHQVLAVEPQEMFLEYISTSDSIYKVTKAIHPDSLLHRLNADIEQSDNNLRRAYTAEAVTYAATAVFGLIAILAGESDTDRALREAASFTAQVGTTIHAESKANQLEKSIHRYNKAANQVMYASTVAQDEYVSGEVHFSTHNYPEKMNVCIPIAGDTLRFEFMKQ